MGVILHHAVGARVGSGYAGVDIFFVISGYVVIASLLRNPSASVSSFLAEFYARRAKRLTPSLLVVVILTTVMVAVAVVGEPAGAVAAHNQLVRDYYISGLCSLIGGANVYYNVRAEIPAAASDEADAGDGGNMYFGAMATGDTDVANTSGRVSSDGSHSALQRNPFMHTWSLGVEEQVRPFNTYACACILLCPSLSLTFMSCLSPFLARILLVLLCLPLARAAGVPSRPRPSAGRQGRTSTLRHLPSARDPPSGSRTLPAGGRLWRRLDWLAVRLLAALGARAQLRLLPDAQPALAARERCPPL